jgi:diaminopimelate decarboxylase
MRLPKLHSRFGNALDDFGNFQRIAESVRALKGKAELGFHFHMPSWVIGVDRWQDSLRSLFVWCQTFEQLTGSTVRHLDLGGGFFPADLEALDFGSIRTAVGEALPGVRAIYFEPGRALTQDGEVLVSRVLDVRRTPGNKPLEVVVDACIAELPHTHAFSHRIFYGPRPRATAGKHDVSLKKGRVRILGRICMEDGSGEGFVIVSSLHPTANDYILAALELTNRDAIAPDIAWKLIDSAIHRKPMPAY